MGWEFLADCVLLFHAAYVGYVVIGLVAILADMAMGWRWVRNFYFRVTHLAAILLVVAESVAGAACPLITLEDSLRRAGGQRAYAGGCLARWVHPLIFFDFPAWVFIAGYIAFGLMVVAVFYLAPPVRPEPRAKPGLGSAEQALARQENSLANPAA